MEHYSINVNDVSFTESLPESNEKSETMFGVLVGLGVGAVDLIGASVGVVGAFVGTVGAAVGAWVGTVGARVGTVGA